MDLSKAFDCIPRGLLIAKMKAYGLSNYACEFLASYLSDRYQRVKISNDYCPIVWNFCGKVNTKKIEKIQERALHFMFNDKKGSYSSLL